MTSVGPHARAHLVCSRARNVRRLKVGVIIPARAPAPYLAEALDSVLGQEPAPAEVVVVDDASPEPVSLHADHAGRCRLVRRATRGGPASARAAGVEALGEVDAIALCDADDAWEPGKLAAQLDALARHPDAGVCVGRAIVVGPDDRPTGERWPDLEAGTHSPDALAQALYAANPIPTSSVVLRTRALAAAGGFESPVELAEDWDLWLSLLAAGESFLSEPRAVIRYRRHPDGATADVAALARCQLAIHARHAGLVDDSTRRDVEARDLTGLADGLVRERRYREAREALRAAADRAPVGLRARMRAYALAVPGVRAAMGRRDPYL